MNDPHDILLKPIKTTTPDNVNSPQHYQGTIETIDYIESLMTETLEFEGYLRGNIIKYISRYPKKNYTEDLKKCRWYLDRLIKLHEERL